ncbi:class I SAM-dependent methyltransferase [Parachitinimonas caeni]|uniref:Class I SAM-dependent methyltransferase n=1 Tax=Parachitinimonas caeni TaxID=3031301 RepID=A0ABT7DV17_9NEIS|nr:class I SAM-dependent methyltransferase [Parachitinimonas caeni]MDK2123904.1 class I SAM-dependent methyltransferase [Parachitinimonas caeni]
MTTSTLPQGELPARAHSEQYFGDYRDYWWNADFLELMARRWGLSRYRTLLDVGCGRCHWSLLLTPFLAPHAEVTALDRDPKWAMGDAAIHQRFEALGASVRFEAGDAAHLPYPDASFEVVTCQTVLIHVADP